jgi:hypothetical protein
MRIESTNRRPKATRRLPTAEIADLFKDKRVHVELGRVFAPETGPHYYIDQQDGKRRVMIEVLTMPGGNDLTCRLATRPIWYLPTPGTIVIVAIPSGEIDHCPCIVGILDSGAADDDIDLERTLLTTDKEFVLKASTGKLGGVDADQPLVLGNKWKEFAEAIIDAIVVHTHNCTAPGSPSGPPINAASFTAQRATLAEKLSRIMSTK